ncbi:CPBP family intramembrane glutamic endopeptidase [Alkaliphilus transvaalensis]|uniref:CPBP family intramembrane glutamic endopeptidase n=1 Tax=Alkaliphilus transvaalensis TaxID=114628 RepID=UPI0005530AD4|nr:type II CAAX endopeptidase family protein [Alkaliphilus transvaalensis]
MQSISKEKKYIKQYIISVYLLFWLVLFPLSGIAISKLGGAPLVMQFLTAINSWVPTIVLLIMFKKLYPNSTLKNFYTNSFRERLNIRLLIVTFLIQLLIFLVSIYFLATKQGFPVKNLLDLSSSTIISAIFFTLIQGAVGEESGWRGYLQQAVEEKLGVIKGSIIVGLIWNFWHAPLWFVSTGYNGIELVKYIIVFSICITSVGVIIGICYHHCKNLLVPIWIHFMLNFYTEFYRGELIDLISVFALGYMILALVFIYWHRLSIRKLNAIEKLN